jgi:hypothetical protein
MLLQVRFLIPGLLFRHTGLDRALLDCFGFGHFLPLCYALNSVCLEEFYETPPVIRCVSWEIAYGAGHSCSLSPPRCDVSVFNRTRECEEILCGAGRGAKVVSLRLDVLARDGESGPDNLGVLLAKLLCVLLVLNVHESLKAFHAPGESSEGLGSVALKRLVDAGAGVGVGRHCGVV